VVVAEVVTIADVVVLVEELMAVDVDVVVINAVDVVVDAGVVCVVVVDVPQDVKTNDAAIKQHKITQNTLLFM
jgi:hypothetical protein